MFSAIATFVNVENITCTPSRFSIETKSRTNIFSYDATKSISIEISYKVIWLTISIEMGYCINCEGIMFNCGYSFWEKFREEIALASVAYLQNEYDVLLANGANDSYLENQLSQLMEHLNIHNCGTVSDFMLLFSEMDRMNIFIYYHMGGVYTLLNKSDDDGYYTIGNSIDILDTFQRIEKYISDEDVKATFPNVQKVFQSSIEKQQLVAIY